MNPSEKKIDCINCFMERLGAETSCAFNIIEQKELCPCLTCLVKPICRSSCNDRTEIIRKNPLMEV
jgi:hypothetical protein